MYRNAIEKLKAWKNKTDKKPLIIRGARQTGKTWLMKEFGRTMYAKTVYVNFDNNEIIRKLFESDINIGRIIAGLELYSGVRITPSDTLLIFDEVQEVPKALTALKYFNENAPEYQIVCAGSLFGIALHKGTSFPVGKVEWLDLYPMNFGEFLLAMGENRFAELLKKPDFGLTDAFAEPLTELLRQYYFVGGMPEAVLHFCKNRDHAKVRELQMNILAAYEQDFSKHAPTEAVPRIRALWNSIPGQLAKENRKFIYGNIREGARAREYEQAMLWLADCGLIHKIYCISAPRLPLKAYENQKAFKLYLVDTGLLACLAGLDSSAILRGNDLFVEFKGALTEQYVLQQLLTCDGLGIHYWANENGTAEVDFLVNAGNEIIPVEVKAETNLKAKSLKVYAEKFKPRVSVRTSLANYRDEGWLVNLPLYAVGYMNAMARSAT